MKKTILKVMNVPWYFVLFAAYPVLALLSYNISQVRYTSGIRPLMFEMDADEAWDIDEELDFAITDFLVQQRMK